MHSWLQAHLQKVSINRHCYNVQFRNTAGKHKNRFFHVGQERFLNLWYLMRVNSIQVINRVLFSSVENILAAGSNGCGPSLSTRKHLLHKPKVLTTLKVNIIYTSCSRSHEFYLLNVKYGAKSERLFQFLVFECSFMVRVQTSSKSSKVNHIFIFMSICSCWRKLHNLPRTLQAILNTSTPRAR